MALFGLDAAGNSAYVQAVGTGAEDTPYILQHDILPSGIKSAWASGTTGQVLVSGVTDAPIRVLSMIITASAGGTIQFRSGASGTTLTPPFVIPASGQLIASNPMGIITTAAGESLETVVGGSINYQALVTYREA